MQFGVQFFPVERFFHRHVGCKPNPIVFLAAGSQRTKRARLVTAAA